MGKPAVININNANIPHEQKSDDSLIMLFQSGEKGVFRHLVDRYQEKVRNLIFSIFNESDIVDDLAQEVFIKAYEGLNNFRFQSSFYTWLYRIAVNRSRDEMRRRKVRRFFTFHSVESTTNLKLENLITTKFDDENIKETIEQSLQKLPEKYRMPIILKDIDGFSYDEIAEALDCEVGTVKSRLSRGRAMLKELLKPMFAN
ncbi:MAG: sigma-70 family RNA polymerase sigma factor [Ignavibacteriales bacterium]|nr:sigma-70 family RNA polymerase sigma factor [Ignavibacteriales bacterium]